jgi:N-glycosylase/DNA lyase
MREFKVVQGIAEMADKVRELTGNPEVKRMVEERMSEFRHVHEQNTWKWYEELVYCLLTAYSSAVMGQKCVDSLKIYGKLSSGSLEEVNACLVEGGHRFAKVRSKYIYDTRSLAPKIKSIVEGFNDSRSAREWLVKNVKGLGWKEASHYLRNVGYFDLAIIDRHIMSNMREHGLIDEDGSKGLTKKRYLKYERILQKVSSNLAMPLGELDLYLWYRKTGKVLK